MARERGARGNPLAAWPRQSSSELVFGALRGAIPNGSGAGWQLGDEAHELEDRVLWTRRLRRELERGVPATRFPPCSAPRTTLFTSNVAIQIARFEII